MAQGLRREPDDMNVMRWNDISNRADRAHLKRINTQERNVISDEDDGTESNQPRDDGEVQLHCAACHQLDEASTTESNDALSAAVDVALSSGRYMAPVKYDHACKACHPLTIDPRCSDVVSHGLSPAHIRGQLLSHFEKLYDRDAQALAGPLRRPPLPDEHVKPASSVISSPEFREKLIVTKTDTAERHLRRLCAKCHDFSSDGEYMDGYTLTSVEPARIPKVWLQHALFDHRAHQRIQGIDCLRCHRQANSEESSAAVMIPDREICLECHSGSPKNPSEQARYDCTECHRYHART
jgi:predicted CXXCH cytochrome family protein